MREIKFPPFALFIVMHHDSRDLQVLKIYSVDAVLVDQEHDDDDGEKIWCVCKKIMKLSDGFIKEQEGVLKKIPKKFPNFCGLSSF